MPLEQVPPTMELHCSLFLLGVYPLSHFSQMILFNLPLLLYCACCLAQHLICALPLWPA